jgi:uncharacterized membrane protein
MRSASIGHLVFAATLIALGIMGLIHGNLAPIWQDVPRGLRAREALGYLCACISLVCGVGLLWNRAAAAAARVLLAYLLLWFLAFKLRHILLAPTVEGSYQTCGETAVIIAASWVLYAGFARDWDRRRLRFATGEAGVRVARVLYALALIAFGLSHFAYLNLTAPLVPRWLPFHVGWAYFTGGAYLAAAVAILIGVYARLAASLVALQMGLFTLLVWVPMLAAGQRLALTGGTWAEFVVSWALTAGGWVVADSYRDIPFLGLRNRSNAAVASSQPARGDRELAESHNRLDSRPTAQPATRSS